MPRRKAIHLHYQDVNGVEQVKEFGDRKAAQDWWWGVEWPRRMEAGPKTTDPFRAAHTWLFQSKVRMASGPLAGKPLAIAGSTGKPGMIDRLTVWTSQSTVADCQPGDLLPLDTPLPLDCRDYPKCWIEGCDDEWGWLDPSIPVSPALLSPLADTSPNFDPELERKAKIYDELKTLGLLEQMGIDE